MIPTPENPTPDHNATDGLQEKIESSVRKYLPEIVAFVSLGAFATPFFHAGADAILNGHLERGVIGYFVGGLSSLAGFTFHWWKNWSVWSRIGPFLIPWWPAPILLLVFYVAGPSVYQRAVPTVESPKPMGRIVWDFEQAARGFSYFLNMVKVPGQEIRVLGFQAHGKNNSGDPVSELKGFLRSDLTNVPHPLYILAQDVDDSKIPACTPRYPTLPQETFGIPAFSDFDVATYDKSFADLNKDGVPASKFLSEFVPFTIALEYDGATHGRRFSREEVSKQIDIFEKSLSLESIPHVVRKANAAAPQLPPLHTPITQATPVPPALPPLKTLIEPPDPMPTGKIP